MPNLSKKKNKKVKFSDTFKTGNVKESKTASEEKLECVCDCSACIDCINK